MARCLWSESLLRAVVMGTYGQGTGVRVTATPCEGWRFDHWEGATTGTTTPITVVMDEHKSVTAVFVEEAAGVYVLSVTTLGQGTGSLDPPGGVYDERRCIGRYQPPH